MRARNGLFACVLCLLLCGPALLMTNTALGLVKLPSWLTTEDATYLSGGVTQADVLAELSVDGFMSGGLQEALEDTVGNYVPAKAKALLWNARLQRSAIAASNALFHWDCTPTFYGSDLVAVADDGRLLETAKKATPYQLERNEAMADAYEAFAERHKDLRVFIYFGPDSLNVDGTPTASLISNPLTYNTVAEAFMAGSPSYTWINGNVPYEEFKDTWYKTDHHWNTRGAYKAYEKIADAMGFGSEVVQPTKEIEYKTPTFYGSLSRRSLDPAYKDHIVDYKFDYPDFKVTIDGKEASRESLVHRKLYTKGSVQENKYANRYAEYFHTDYGLIEIENPEVKMPGSLLLVGDSYSNCMERFLAFHFQKTYVLDPRHEEGTLDDFLAEHLDVEDVVFVMRSTNLLSDVTKQALQ